MRQRWVRAHKTGRTGYHGKLCGGRGDVRQPNLCLASNLQQPKIYPAEQANLTTLPRRYLIRDTDACSRVAHQAQAQDFKHDHSVREMAVCLQNASNNPRFGLVCYDTL